MPRTVICNSKKTSVPEKTNRKMNITKRIKTFTDNEKSTGVTLIFCTLISLILANSFFGKNYLQFWQNKLGGLSLEHWINDALMSIFFFLIGLELVRETKMGQLSNIKGALLPIFAAIGGMIIPASFYLLFNYGTETQSGSGIPMATDIAFSIGILTLLGKRVPLSLKVFLTALAVIDDLGAILVIAIFYSKGILWTNLLIALAIFGLLLLLNKMKIKNLFIFLIGGIVMWYFMLHSGVHATITGVLLAFTIPFGNGNKTSTAHKLEHFLHKPVNFIILPIFALANTAILLEATISETVSQNYSLGIATGLVIGKPLGILVLSFIAVKTGICKLPNDLNWKAIFNVGFLAGIGFTMSIFITLLAFENPTIINNSKLIILISSFIAGLIGFLALKSTLKLKT